MFWLRGERGDYLLVPQEISQGELSIDYFIRVTVPLAKKDLPV
jgi:hypothetical protein